MLYYCNLRLCSHTLVYFDVFLRLVFNGKPVFRCRGSNPNCLYLKSTELFSISIKCRKYQKGKYEIGLVGRKTSFRFGRLK